jgi:hypothetical protein
MFKLLAVALVALLAGCATVDFVPTDYAGPDAGKVVLGIGAATGTLNSSYSLKFRKKGLATTEKPAIGWFTYMQDNLFHRQEPDYQSPTEMTLVLVKSLPPGEYEIYNFDVTPFGSTNYSSRYNFSIPFSVKAGQTTYIGNYQANKLTTKNLLGLSEPAGAFFVVSDRMQTELPIAETKSMSKLEPVQDSTPEPGQIGSPFFVSPQQTGDAK